MTTTLVDDILANLGYSIPPFGPKWRHFLPHIGYASLLFPLPHPSQLRQGCMGPSYFGFEDTPQRTCASWFARFNPQK